MTGVLWTASVEAPVEDELILAADIPWPEALGFTPNTALFENPDKGVFVCEIYLTEKPQEGEIALMEEALKDFLGLAKVRLNFEKIQNQDWVAKSLEGLKPLEIGRFYVHGAHDKTNVPEGKIGIQIEASLAFGTGHHETTRGCLLALGNLADETPRTILDLGTGSGILAIAAGHVWPVANLTASDNDPEAIQKSVENFSINGTPQIKALVAEGFEAPEFQNKKFDLIIANILAGPLVELAPDIGAHLKDDGGVILAGLLEDQKADVLKAYEKQGFVLLSETSENGWPTLVLKLSR